MTVANEERKPVNEKLFLRRKPAEEMKVLQWPIENESIENEEIYVIEAYQKMT